MEFIRGVLNSCSVESHDRVSNQRDTARGNPPQEEGNHVQESRPSAGGGGGVSSHQRGLAADGYADEDGDDMAMLQKFRLGTSSTTSMGSQPLSQPISTVEESWMKKHTLGIQPFDTSSVISRGNIESRDGGIKKLNYLRLPAALVAKAMYPYGGEGADELPFAEGEQLFVIGEALDDDGWYVCRNQADKVGLVPETHIQAETSLPAEGFVTGVAMYNFDATNVDELSFKVRQSFRLPLATVVCGSPPRCQCTLVMRHVDDGVVSLLSRRVMFCDCVITRKNRISGLARGKGLIKRMMHWVLFQKAMFVSWKHPLSILSLHDFSQILFDSL